MKHQSHTKLSKDDNQHWFLKEELKFRSLASAVWTWCMSFPALAVFIVLLSLDPSRHIYVIFDIVNTISTIRTWFICSFVATFTALLVHLHFNYYEVVSVNAITQFGVIAQALRPANLIHNISNGVYGFAVAHSITHLVQGRFTYIYHPCSFDGENGNLNELCLNESWFITVIFGLIMSTVKSMNFLLNHKNTLSFLQVQEARFLNIKCKLPCMVSACAAHSFKVMQRFLIMYYLVGFILRDATAFVLGVLPSEQHLLSIWSIFNFVLVSWNLWLFGTLLSVLWELSWQLFNIYNTQNHTFQFDSVFPEDKPKLLTENLDSRNPPVVQHLAYQCLSLLAKEDPMKRQQIFALNHQTENGRPIWWNKVADSCLARIRQLTDALGEYQVMLAAHADGRQHVWSTSSSSTNPSDESTSESTLPSVSLYRRRQLDTFQDSVAEKTNLSCLNMSSLNATQSINPSTVAVPVPRLWTSTVETPNGGESTTHNRTKKTEPQMRQTMAQSRFEKVVIKLKSLPLIAYFVSVIPNYALLNLYREHLIHKWAMQSLSYLCAASIEEDKFGVVQARLHEVLATLLELLVALEKLGKVSGTSTQVHRLRTSLHQECKSSLHRIADAFGDSLKSVNLSQEHRRRMQTFMDYSE